jgi:hypothetical protein
MVGGLITLRHSPRHGVHEKPWQRASSRNARYSLHIGLREGRWGVSAVHNIPERPNTYVMDDLRGVMH